MEKEKSKSRNWLPIAIVVLVVILVLGFFTLRKQRSVAEPLVIGGVYTLSGPYSSYGIEYKRGTEMAVEEINAKGGVDGHPINLVIEDDAGDVTKSISAFRKLANTDHARLIITNFSAQTQALSTVAEESKVVNIGMTVSKIGTGKYVFRDYWDMEDAGAAIGEALVKENIKNLGILALNYSDTNFFLTGLNSTTEGVAKNIEKFNFGDTDFRTQLIKLNESKPEGILIYSFPGAEATKIVQQIADLKMDNLKLFSGNTTFGFPFMYEPLSSTLAKMNTIDAWYSIDQSNDKSSLFTQKYKTKYGQDLTGDAAYPYDDIYAFKQAVEKVGVDATNEQIANALREVEYKGVAGNLTFDSMGNSKRSSYLQRYTTSGWEKYTK